MNFTGQFESEFGAFENSNKEYLALKTPKFIPGLSQVHEKYDLYLLDQWGVLHNGVEPYPGVIDTLKALKAHNKYVIILSNSGLRADLNIIRLESLGITRDLYSSVVTSGELAWNLLKESKGAFSEFRERKCFLISSDNSSRFMKGLDIPLSENLEDADFILLTGLSPDISEAVVDWVIDTGISRGLPLICANPDHIRITTEGLKPSAGMVALRYEAAGGAVIQVGKPFKEIYRFAINSVGCPSHTRVLAIGDSLHHDIAGGNSVKCDTMLILQGILSRELTEFKTSEEKESAILRMAQCESEIPNWIAETLSW